MRIKLTIAAFLFLSLIVQGAGAGKMYKWVDEKGEVHFSQTPPIKGQDGIAPDQVTVGRIKSSVLRPHERQGYFYCNDLRLPVGTSRRPLTIDSISRNISAWEKNLKRSRDALKRFLLPKRSRYSQQRYSGVTFEEKLDQLQKPVRTYECAVEWGQDKLYLASGGNSELNNSVETAKEDLAVANAQLVRRCGKEPPSYNTYGIERDRHLRWERCIRKNNAVVRLMERKLQDARRAAGHTR